MDIVRLEAPRPISLLLRSSLGVLEGGYEGGCSRQFLTFSRPCPKSDFLSFQEASDVNRTDDGDLSKDPKESLLEEANRLQQLGLLAREALEYKQVFEYFQVRFGLLEVFEKTKILTRRFAKNQRTWLRRFGSATWIPMANRKLTDVRGKFRIS